MSVILTVTDEDMEKISNGELTEVLVIVNDKFQENEVINVISDRLVIPEQKFPVKIMKIKPNYGSSKTIKYLNLFLLKV